MRNGHEQLALFTTVLTLILSACSVQSREPEIVEITLTEFGIESSVPNFEVGQPYRFVITNDGAVNHEFTIMPPMMTAPTEMEGHNMEDMMGAMLHIGEEQLPSRTAVTVEFTFTQTASLGVIEFACHLPGHYEAGMYMPISVDA